MEKLAQQTIGALVADDARRAGVFEQYDIDFCCGGGRTLEAACAEGDVALDEITQALQAVERAEAASTDPSAHAKRWSPGFLADYIVNEYHSYVRENVPVLRGFSRKVARVHGKAHPETVQIAEHFEELAAELLCHTQEEEDTLFPYIKALAAEEEGAEQEAFDTVQEPIRAMEDDHDHAGALMGEIRTLSDDFTPPEDACSTYRALYAKLEEFEANLHQHVHLENNILFPKAAALGAA